LGWIPDFAIDIPGLGPALLECKPALSLEELEPSTLKIERSGYEGDVLLVGARWGEHLGLRIHLPDGIWLPFGITVGDGGVGLTELTVDPHGLLKSGWIAAGNETQWRSRR
jgi:hypothetical protein